APFLVRDIDNGTRGAWPSNVTAANGSVFFTVPIVGVEGYTNGDALWWTDGRVPGAVRLAVWDDTWGSGLFAIGSRVVAMVSGPAGPDLWGSDGTPAGTHALGNFHHRWSLSGFVKVGTRVFFTADDFDHSVQVWVSD